MKQRKFVTYERLEPDYGIPYSRVHLSRLERSRKFPKRVHLGENRIAWFDDELAEFQASRAKARESEQAA